MRKSFDFDTIQIGEELGRKVIAITDEMVRTSAHAIESTRDWYTHASPFGAPIAPPTVFDNDTLRMLDEQYARFGSVHAKQSWEFKSPARVGTSVTVTVHVVDKYVRRSGQYIVMELKAVDEDGVEICRGLHTSLMSMHKG